MLSSSLVLKAARILDLFGGGLVVACCRKIFRLLFNRKVENNRIIHSRRF
jgi:hypothetical protein